MTKPIRPDIVSVLVTLTPEGPPATWTRDDGQPITPAELDTVIDATRAELEAARDYVRRVADYAAEKVNAINRIHQITDPYLTRNPRPTPLELVALVTGPERTELAELLDLVAPDGGTGHWLK